MGLFWSQRPKVIPLRDPIQTRLSSVTLPQMPSYMPPFFRLPKKGMHVLQLHDLLVDADNGNPGVALSGDKMVESVLVVIDQLLPLEDQRVVTADCRNRFLQCRATGTRFLPSLVLLDEVPGRKRGDLIGPFHDTITVLDLDAFVGVQVQDESLGRNLGQGCGGNRKQQDDS